MSGPGRPTKTEVERRRRTLLRFVIASAIASEEGIKRIAKKLETGEKTVLLDLEALHDEIESPAIEQLPEDLLEAIQKASSFRLLKALGERVMVEMLKGTITRELGQALTDALREQRHTLRAMRDEQGHAALKALEILTPQEHEVLKAYRATLVPPALKPGEFPPPPQAKDDEPKPIPDADLARGEPEAPKTEEPKTEEPKIGEEDPT